MRTIEDIEADIELTQMCDYPTCTPCDPDWVHEGIRCARCKAIYSINLPDLERELRATITDGIETDALKAICAAYKDGRYVELPCCSGSNIFRLCPPNITGDKEDCRACPYGYSECATSLPTDLTRWYVKALYSVSDDFIWRHRDEFGTIFHLTREAAEAALNHIADAGTMVGEEIRGEI